MTKDNDDDNGLNAVYSEIYSHYEDEGDVDKTFRKFRESPSMLLGFGGFIGVVTYGFYNIKKRKFPLSVYLIQMRVMAQGFVVGCCTLGLAYNLFKDNIYPKLGIDDNSKDNTIDLNKTK